MNTLIITLGNSEIQFNLNQLESFEYKNGELSLNNLCIPVRVNNRIGQNEWLIPISARHAGKIILEKYEEFKPILRFPIIEPLVSFIKKETIGKVLFVVTDQEDKNYSKGDTLYYAPIIRKYFEENSLTDISYENITVRESVKDVDVQYRFFGDSLPEALGKDSIEKKFYLFAQGGIDQINHALTLQLLQKYKDRVAIYQKAESEELRKVSFPQLFLADLTWQKIEKHLDDLDFGKAAELILNNPKAETLARNIHLKLNLNHEGILGSEWQKYWSSLSDIEKKNRKIQDLVYAYRIDFHQKKYNDGLTKLYTVYENIFKQLVDEYTKIETQTFYNKKIKFGEKNEKWENFLKDKFGPNIIDRLKEKKNDLNINNPNAMTYFYLLRFLIKDEKENRFSDNEVKKLDGMLNKMRYLRNQINHSLGNATLDDLQLGLGSNYSLEDLNGLLDKFAGTKGLEPILKIKKDIIKCIRKS